MLAPPSPGELVPPYGGNPGPTTAVDIILQRIVGFLSWASTDQERRPLSVQIFSFSCSFRQKSFGP